MSRLLPSRPDLSRRDEPEPRLLTIDDEAADEVFEALASGTARTIFGALHDEPATASALAEAADTSLQNTRYHLEQLAAADLVEAAGTQYSSKGREMTVYAPADEPLVMLASADPPAVGLRALLERFVGAVAALAVLSLLIHALVEGGLAYVDFTAAGGTGDGPERLPFATGVFLGAVVGLGLAVAWSYWGAERVAPIDWVRRYPALSGRDLATSRRAVAAATVGAVVLAGVWLGTAAFDVVLRAIGPFGPAQWLLFGLVAAAAGQAYVNDGLLVSWAVIFVPLFALAMGSIGVGLAGEGLAAVVGVIGYPVLVAAVGAVTVGTVGFLSGVGLRLMIAWLTGGASDR